MTSEDPSQGPPGGSLTRAAAAALIFAFFFSPLPSFAMEGISPANLFARQFYLTPSQKLRFRTVDVEGLVFVNTPSRLRNTLYSVVTDFDGPAVKSRYITGLNSSRELQDWVKNNLKKEPYKGVVIRRLVLPVGIGDEREFFWVGHKAYASRREARQQIEVVREVVKADGGNFPLLVKEAQKAFSAPEALETPPKTRAQFLKEEELFLKYTDHLDIGNKMFGPFQGEGVGEPIVWQSFGETSWRLTNLESNSFDSQVGFWANRIIFKGIKFPLNTIDPFVEVVGVMESNGIDFKDNLQFQVGAEWRPFARSAALSNFRPLGGIPLLEWVKSYRIFAAYINRKNLKDEITGSKSDDFTAGVGIFYEFGVEPPPLDEAPPSTVSDYVRRYVWGEYFGAYQFFHTGLSAEDDFNAVIFNSSIILGLKLPGVPLPANPFLDEMVFMPYMRFEHVNNTEISFPFQNRYFVAAGLRWMPFLDYRYKDNEWLSKTKFFGEWVGVGRVQNAKQDGEAPYAVDYDLRFGVNISSRRF